MANSNLNYSQYFETLIALVTHLAIIGGNEGDSANAPKLAQHLGLDEEEVKYVLTNFKGIFRRSENKSPSQNFGMQYKYTLQLRYARRKYIDGILTNAGEAITNEDLFALLGFITNKIKEEQENERQLKSNRVTVIGVWIAAAMSLLSVVISFLK